jgi:predicted amidophosphoribosyltransferase
MPPIAPFSRLRQVRDALLPCRGCLGPLEGGGEAGLCARCWAGLLPLSEGRCPRCALVHAEAEGDAGGCPEPAAWDLGDALWDYHGGRPPLGALLVPGLKHGEAGWRTALLGRLAGAPLPPWAAEADLVTSAPSAWPRRLLRGFDFGAEAGQTLAERLGRPWRPLLTKAWRAGRQAERPESARRRLPRQAIALRPGPPPSGLVLLVDDVWTTGTTLLRCAQALKAGGAAEVRVLALFRAM